MFVMNITDDYNDTLTTIITNIFKKTISSNCTINENNNDKIIPTLFLTLPCVISFLYLIFSMVYTLIKPLKKQLMEKFLYPIHRFRCIITGPNECGK